MLSKVIHVGNSIQNLNEMRKEDIVDIGVAVRVSNIVVEPAHVKFVVDHVRHRRCSKTWAVVELSRPFGYVASMVGRVVSSRSFVFDARKHVDTIVNSDFEDVGVQWGLADVTEQIEYAGV